MHFTELEQFGWNWLTASFLVVSLITTWQYRAYFLQAREVWTKKSTESLSVSMATALGFITTATLWYGIEAQKLTIAYTGGICIFGIALAIGAWRFGRPRRIDYAVLLVCSGWSFLVFTDLNAAFVYSGFSAGILIPLLLQVREMYQTKSRGVLHLEWLLTNLVKNAFLNVFAYTSGDIVYIIFSPILFAISIWQMVLWMRYGKSQATVVPSPGTL